MTVDLATAQGTFFLQEFEDAILRVSRLLIADFRWWITERIKHIGMLAKARGEHQVDDGGQRIKGRPGHLFRQFELHTSQDRQRVEQAKDGFCIGHGGLADKFQHHTLSGLPAKGHGNQVTRSNFPFQFGGQAIVKNSRDRWNIDSNSGKDGHFL